MDVSEIGVPQNGWFIMESPIKIDDLRVPLFSETSIYTYMFFLIYNCIPPPSWDSTIAPAKSQCPYLMKVWTLKFRPFEIGRNTVDGQNPAPPRMMIIPLFNIIYRVLTIPGGAGFCPSTVVQDL